MTREKAMEIKKLLDKGGEIDKEGYITGCCVWTTTIEDILRLDGMIYFNDVERLMQISNWPERLSEPEWKQKVREILESKGITIDNDGDVHGLIFTHTIKAIIEAGGNFMLCSTGEASISNWR